MEDSFTIEKLTVDDFKLTLSWAKKEKWNCSEEDAEPFMSLDPEGFFIGKLNGEPIATIYAIKYRNYAHIGFYLVEQGHRKNGYGKRIFEHAFNSAKHIGSMGIIAIESQKANYEKWGFRTYDHNFKMVKKAEETVGHELVDLRQVPIEQLGEYDMSVFGEDRKVLLSGLIEQKRCYGLGKIKDNKLVGYAIMRRCYHGLRIGPFIADNKEIASEILDGLQSLVVGEDLSIDVYESNKDAIEITEKRGWSNVSKQFRMYVGSIPKVDMSKVYGTIIAVG